MTLGGHVARASVARMMTRFEDRVLLWRVCTILYKKHAVMQWSFFYSV